MESTPLTVRDPEACHLAAEIAAFTGKPLARVVVEALRAEAARLKIAVDAGQVRQTLAELREFLRARRDQEG